MKPISECRLYGILDTGYVQPDRMEAMACSLIAGGIDILQLRAKRETPGSILSMARVIAPLCREAGIPFLLNDHPALVREAGADGVHVGQDDVSVEEARHLAGEGALVGKSTHSPEQAAAAVSERPDYIGFGPLFPTPTKPDYTPIGTSGIRSVLETTPFPVFCIGGISLDTLARVVAAGARRVVIVSDLLLARDPATRVAECRALLGS
jgi:thiamine-phosphate pyrophosphorylase